MRYNFGHKKQICTQKLIKYYHKKCLLPAGEFFLSAAEGHTALPGGDPSPLPGKLVQRKPCIKGRTIDYSLDIMIRCIASIGKVF
jgi:hypothetical protein